MGNSNSTSRSKKKQDDDFHNFQSKLPTEVDSSFAHPRKFRKNQRRKKKKNHRRRPETSSSPTDDPNHDPPIHDDVNGSFGIASHPYQMQNPGQYQEEYSSSSSEASEHYDDHGSDSSDSMEDRQQDFGYDNRDADLDADDLDESKIEPRGLFREDSLHSRISETTTDFGLQNMSMSQPTEADANANANVNANKTRISMDSLAYSKDSSHAKSFGSETTNCIGVQPMPSHDETSTISHMSRSTFDTGTGSGTTTTGTTSLQSQTSKASSNKGAGKKGKKKLGLFRLKNHDNLKYHKTQSPVPYEKSLSFVIDQAYGKSPARPADRHNNDNNINTSAADTEHIHIPSHKAKLIPRENRASSHRRNRSIFDGKLPTIDDETDPKAHQGKKLTTSIHGELVEGNYDVEEGVKIHQHYSPNEDDEKENLNHSQASMVSLEYTATTIEADQIRPYPYSVTKGAQNLANIKLMIDRQHASYVEGEEPLKDMSVLPTTNLGDLFADVTLNDASTVNNMTMNQSGCKDLDRTYGSSYDAAASRGGEEVSPDQTRSVRSSSSVSVRSKFGFAKDTKKALSGQDSLKDSDSVDDAEVSNDSFDLFLQDREIAKRDSGNNFDSGDGASTDADKDDEEEGDAVSVPNIDTKESSVVLSDSSVDDSVDDSIFQGSSRVYNDVLSESSVDSSKMDDSLFQGVPAGDYRSVLSESSVEDSTADESLLFGESGKGASHSRHGASSQGTNEDQTNDDLLDENSSNIQNTSMLNRTDMAIQEDNILDRTDMAIVLKDVEKTRNLDMLDTFHQQGGEDDDSASKILASFNPSPETRSVFTQPTVPLRKKKGVEREHSPFPVIESNAVPISSKLTNILPDLSTDETEDDGDDLYFEQKGKMSFKQDELEKMYAEFSAKKLAKTAELPNAVVEPCTYKGPEIGTIIKLVKKDRKSDEAPEQQGTMALVEKPLGSKDAFSREVANNAAFLFDGERNLSQQTNVSKVDNQRLSMLQGEIDDHEYRRASSLNFPTVDITEDDSLETIQLKLEQLKIQNKKTNSTGRQSSVSITRSLGEIRINGSRHFSSLDTELCASTQAISNTYQDPKLAEPSTKEPSQSVVSVVGAPEAVNETDTGKCFAGSKRNRFEVHLSAHNSSPRTSIEENLSSDAASKNSYEDDISISDLHKKYTAITPMKTKSPHIRFKKAMRMFNAHHEDNNNNRNRSEPRKTPPRKNAASSKENFVFSKVTSINGRLRQNSQRSLKKKRRLTSGDDVIAPRKPTLVNPLFRNLSKIDDNGDSSIKSPGRSISSVQDIVKEDREQKDVQNFHKIDEDDDGNRAFEAYSGRESNCLGFVEGGGIINDVHGHVTASTGQDNDDREGEHDSSFESLKGSSCLDSVDESSASSPYDEQDELDLSPSSSAGNKSSQSIDEIAQLMNSSSTELSHTSYDSPIHQPTGLRSAMKKSRGDKNENIRVSWFGEQDDEHSESPLESFENRLARSPVDASECMIHSSGAVSGARNENPNEVMRTKKSFLLYSPTNDSLQSKSPQNQIPIMTSVVSSPTDLDMSSSKENVEPYVKGTPDSMSPMQTFQDKALVKPLKRQGPVGASELDLSPGPGRRTPGQNSKWSNTSAANSPGKKSSKKTWRELKQEHDTKKKVKLSSKKKNQGKKTRLSGITKTSLFL